MEPELPFEFLVQGTPRSQQASTRSQERWKQAIRSAARGAMPEGAWLLEVRLAVTIFLFPEGQLQGDIDNCVKPILDALTGCLYTDDALIERLVVQKFELNRRYDFVTPSRVLARALDEPPPLLYIRVTDDVHEELS